MQEKDNIVYVGQKATMAYVLAVTTQLKNGNKKITIKARGKAISRAVDVSEIFRNKVNTDTTISDIRTGTEEVETDQGQRLKVSYIEIDLRP